eukprot:TRINITY_DN50154_c0_g1_i1.p1 TRINITY_DN50154_c0_g1~~TRINITY_DN50154_c0_g1_i1.p1  ORF type:complete len:418 (-),score=65.06 TRINITY_DN50154_c0_g1_i1:18-1271(-)
MAVPSWVVPAVAQTLLFVLIAGMAATVDVKILRNKFGKRRGGIALGLMCQFIILPAAGFSSTQLFRLPPVLGISLLAVTSAPGGAYSNLWCSLLNADMALSVAMTTCATLLCMIMTPANLFLYCKLAYGQDPEINFLDLLGSIVVAVFALPAGMALSYRFPSCRNKFNLIGNVAGLALIAFSAVFSSTRDPIWNKDGIFYLAVGLPCVLGLLLSVIVGLVSRKVSKPEAVAITVETCYQNTGIAMAIALATFGEEQRGKAAGVPLFYGVCQVVLLPNFLLTAWKLGCTYAPARAGIHRVIMQNWQPQEAAETSAKVDEDRSPTISTSCPETASIEAEEAEHNPTPIEDSYFSDVVSVDKPSDIRQPLPSKLAAEGNAVDVLRKLADESDMPAIHSLEALAEGQVESPAESGCFFCKC